MAKKQRQAKNSDTQATQSRKRMLSREEVRKASLTLSQQSADLQAQAAVMQKNELAAIEIDGVGLLERGVSEIDRFIDNVDKGVNRAKRDKDRSSM